MGIIWWIVAGLIAGWLTGKIMKGSGYGAIVDICSGLPEPLWAGSSPATSVWPRRAASSTRS
jgi:uncharacterized membrane protein YeaQ/YmgE (transglycosylase-associated protein family)